MCIIIAKHKNVAVPSEEILKRCAEKNRDGIGIAYTFRGGVRIKKDFNDVEALLGFIGANVKVTDACLIHFRIATAGLTDIGNRHPFPLTTRRKRLRAMESTTDIAVAHNGTFSQLRDHKKYSDTLLFVRNILANPAVRNNLHTHAVQELISGYINSSKLAMLNGEGKIIRFGMFHSEDGVWYSNLGYKAYETNTVYDYQNRKEKCIGCGDLFPWKDVDWIRGDENPSKSYGYCCKPCAWIMKNPKVNLVKSGTHTTGPKSITFHPFKRNGEEVPGSWNL